MFFRFTAFVRRAVFSRLSDCSLGHVLGFAIAWGCILSFFLFIGNSLEEIMKEEKSMKHQRRSHMVEAAPTELPRMQLAGVEGGQ